MSRCCEEYRGRGREESGKKRKKGRKGIGHNKQEGERMRRSKVRGREGTEKKKRERGRSSE